VKKDLYKAGDLVRVRIGGYEGFLVILLKELTLNALSYQQVWKSYIIQHPQWANRWAEVGNTIKVRAFDLGSPHNFS